MAVCFIVLLHKTDEVSLVFDHNLNLGSPVDEQIVSVLKFEVLSGEFSELVIVLGFKLSSLTIK